MVVVTLAFAPPAGGNQHATGILPPGDWSEEQQTAAVDLIRRTEEALPAFSDPATLEDLGFYNFGITAPGGYDHWINPGWIDDEHLLDPRYPESVVFQYTEDDEYVPVAAMFFLRTGQDMSDIPADLAWWPGWHTHDELCVDEDGRFSGLVNQDGTCFSGSPSDFPAMMHAWIVDNACGHRFGGVGVSGLHCDVHGHPGGHPPGTHPPGTHPPGTHPPGEHPPGTHPPGTQPPGHQHPTPQPARPVHVHPNATG